MNGEPVGTWTMVTGLVGGLALFLLGLEQLSTALRAVVGNRLRVVLARFTGSRLRALGAGAFFTAVVQSSSVTTVLVVGFIAAGILNLTEAVGLIMGANIGSTVTAQVIAFPVTRYGLLLVASGFLLRIVGRSHRIRGIGTAVMGLGLLFFGMSVMSGAMAPLRESASFSTLATRLESPWLAIAIGAAFTAVVQSSAATTGVVIALGGQGLLPLEVAIALILGANVGTCATALLAAIGKPTEAVRAAWIHVLFNLAGVLLWLPLVSLLAALTRQLSPVDDLPRQIANAHTLFNVCNALIFLPVAGYFVTAVQRLVPERVRDDEALARARYLRAEVLSTPALALDHARLEILHAGERVDLMLERILPALLDGDEEELLGVRRLDDAVDALHGAIITYLGEISQHDLSEKQTGELMRLFEAVNDLESIGDLVETNLVALGLQRVEFGVAVSPATRGVISRYHRVVAGAVETALVAVTQKNELAARQVIDLKPEVVRLTDEAALHQAQRLVATEPQRLSAYTIETDVLRNLGRVYYFAKRMARAALRDEQD